MKTIRKKRRVVAFGVFDLLHPGHLAFLTAARALGDALVVVVARDARVKKEKGSVSVFNQKERLQMVAALTIVNRAVLGDPPGEWRILQKLGPVIVALGHDQKIPPQTGRSVHFVTIPAKKRNRYSSSRLRKALDARSAL